MMSNKYISNLLLEQFPDFYKEEGRDFIQFVVHYYEFLEQDTQALNKSRSLLEYGDIDETLDDFVTYFMKKYAINIPNKITGDKRYFEKHILDLYRSKGSIEGLKLLFRFLYNEEIDVYIPAYDILKPSDGSWIVKRYVEISEKDKNKFYDGELITGASSGATAFVESYERRLYNDRPVHVLFLSNITGNFENDELITSASVSALEGATILGSVSFVRPTVSATNNNTGDLFVANNGSGEGLSVTVNTVADQRGSLNFTLQPGNYGYGNDSIVTITTGANTTGTGANVVIGEIANTVNVVVSNISLIDYLAVSLGANNYANNANDVSVMATSNLSTTIATAIESYNKEVGELISILVTNIGEDYDDYVTVTILDPHIANRYIVDEENGGYWGRNANVTNFAEFGANTITGVTIKDSGFGYANNETITFVNAANSSVVFTGIVSVSGVGNSAGYWKDTKSFLNSNKYVQDSFFYQEFSYQIKSSRSLNKYIRILKQLMHPAGNEPFGKVQVLSVDDQATDIVSSTITQV